MLGDSGDDHGGPIWNWLGRNAVGSSSSTGSRRIKVPEPARSALDLSAGDPIYWAFEANVGFLILACQPLSGDEYKNQGRPVSLGDENDDYRATVPSIFFADYHDRTELESPIPERARVRAGEDRHFVARDAMFDRDPQTCYLLTREQLEISMGTGDSEWSDRLNARPQFLR